MRKLVFSLLFVLLLPVELFAWGQEGHRIIAQIAYDCLRPSVRHRVDKIMGEKKGIVYAANWPDEIKSDTIYPESHDWHFQDFDGGMSDSAVIAALTDYPKEGGNLFRASDSLIACLVKDGKDRTNLTFIVHFTGDRFCPMHTAHMDDLGGNRVRVEWFHQKTNLHAVWDSKLIESQGYSYSEYAEMLESRYGRERKRVEKMSDEEILLHNYHLCCRIYEHHAAWNGNAYHYTYQMKNDMEWQLFVAGIRLAKLLNSLY